VPKVSVIIPTFNRSQLLERALNSVLSQSFNDFEIIVIDDASTDKTIEQLQKNFKQEIKMGIIRYIRNEENKGRSTCRNTGIKLAEGELIAFLDDDDYWLPEHLGTLSSFIDEHKNIGIAFSNWLIVNEQTQKKITGVTKIKTGTGDEYLKLMLRALIGYPSTGIVKTELLKQIGGFNPNLTPREDWELFAKCAMKAGIGFVDKITVHIHEHEGSYSRNKSQWVNSTEFAWNSIMVFAKKYGIKLEKKILSERALRLSRAFITIGEFDKAKKYLFNAIICQPWIVFSSIAIENTFKLAIGKRLYIWYKS